MNLALTSPHQHVPIRPKIAGSAGHIALTAALLAVCLFGTTAQATDDPPIAITILLYNYVKVPPATLVAAEREANKILSAAGARVDWVHCALLSAPNASELCRRGWTPQTPGLRFIAGTNRLQPREYGYTNVPVLITVYYDKIAHQTHRDYGDAEIPVVLGCVMAHELGHLLLRTPQHFKSGIMQPEWGKRQIRDGLTGHALFTREQAVRIQSQARILASLPRSPGKQATP